MEDLDALVRRVDPNRWLASRFIPDAQARADVIAVYAFDHEVGRAPKVVSNAILGEIRLTWWADAVAEIFEGRAVRRHPVTLALSDAIGRRGLPREPFDRLIDLRFPELDQTPPDRAAVAEQGMRLAAAILGVPEAQVRAAAEAAAHPTAENLKLANRELRLLPPAAFPAVAQVALAPRAQASELGKRLRLAWAVLRGRV